MKIVLPPGLLSAKDFETIVDHVEDLTYDIKLVRFKLINPSTIDFKPGQFMQIKVPGIEVVRAYSLASNPSEKDFVEMIIRYVPKGQQLHLYTKPLKKGIKSR